MNLYNHIKLILSENETFCKDGVLFKNSVVSALETFLPGKNFNEFGLGVISVCTIMI